MDVLANHSIFQELQLVHDTGYFSAMPSLEENWQQVSAPAPHRKPACALISPRRFQPARRAPNAGVNFIYFVLKCA